MAYVLMLEGEEPTVELDFDRLYAQLLDGEHDRVRARCRAVLSVDNGAVWPHLLLGYVDLAQRDFEAAEESFAKATLLGEPLRSEALAGKGRALFGASRHEEALILLRDLLQSNPDCHFGWYALGEGLLELGDYEGAWQCAERAVVVCPTSMANVSFLVNTGARLSRHAELATRLLEVQRAQPWNLDVRGARALSLLHEGRRAEAADELMRVLSFAPFAPVSPTIMNAVQQAAAALKPSGES